MSDPRQLSNLVDLDDIREKLRASVRTPEEIAAWQEDRDRMIRTGISAAAQVAVEGLSDRETIEAAGEIRPDEHCRAGLAWARAWTPERPGAVIWGAVGSGKTTLLGRLCQRLGQPTRNTPDAAGFSVCLSSAPRLLSVLAERHIRGGYGEAVAALARVDVLVLDDLGVGLLRRGWTQYLLDVLGPRLLARRPLLATSNLDPETDPLLGLRYHPDDEPDAQRLADRLRALSPDRVRYDSPASRRGP